MHACMHVRTYVRKYVCMYVRTYVCMYVCTYACTFVWMYVCIYICTVFIRIEARAFISYKRLSTRHLYEPFLHFIQAPIHFRVLNPCAYSGPSIYMSPAFIRINTVYVCIVGVKIKFTQCNRDTTVVCYAIRKVNVVYLQYTVLCVKLTLPNCVVPLIYNFTSIHVYTCGAMMYLM